MKKRKISKKIYAVPTLIKEHRKEQEWKRGKLAVKEGKKYVILCEKANGVHADIYSSICMLCTSQNTWEPFRSQYEAYKELFKIWQELGKFHVSILKYDHVGKYE